MTAPRNRGFELFGPISCARFLREYWQRKPLLVRAALPDIGEAMTRDQLFGLAARDDVESRLIRSVRGRWSLEQGPISKAPSARSNWTLLVQGVNLHVAHVDELMRRFAFVPYTSLDDLMVSYAVDGGGVGPHFDSYDVFLIQASGQRRWRISSQTNLDLVDGLPVKILKHFQPEEEWVLEAGDMLYLPPHIAHDGVALGESVTYSVGFRAPGFTELAREFLFALGESVELEGRLTRAHGPAPRAPAKIEDGLVTRLLQELGRIRISRTAVADFAGSYFSEPKPHVFFEAPPAIPAKQWLRRAAAQGIALDLKTQMLYRGGTFYVNGECIAAPRGAAPALRELANRRRLSARRCAQLAAGSELASLLRDWYESGWVIMGG